MKHLATFSALLGALSLAAPSTGWTKDKHHDHDDHDDHHHHGHSSAYYRSYRPYPYSGYGYYPGYYARPSVGLSFTTAPSYRTYYSDSGHGDDLAVDVQRALARRGFYRGAIDGEVGPGTRSAIREYQYRNRLEVTGRIDRSLLHSLGVG